MYVCLCVDDVLCIIINNRGAVRGGASIRSTSGRAELAGELVMMIMMMMDMMMDDDGDDDDDDDDDG
jgi:hypothetical protein